MNRPLVVLTVLFALVAVFPGCKPAPPETAAATEIRIGLVTDTGGRGDFAFNDLALRGLEQWAAKLRFTSAGLKPMSNEEYAQGIRAQAPDLADRRITPFPGIRPLVLQSQNQTDYRANLLKLATDEGCRLVIGVGFLLEPDITAVARDYPQTRFMLIDATPLDTAFQPITLPNLQCYLFAEQEAGFLVGVIAGLATRKGKVGFLGGMEIPPVLRYEAGFRAGVKTVNPAAYGDKGSGIPRVYVGDFSNVTGGKQATVALLGQGCDIVFQAAGATGNGMYEALREAGGPAKGLWGIGSDVDAGQNPALYPEGTLSCTIKHVDYATYLSIQSVLDGSFQGGVNTMTLKDGGMGYAPGKVHSVLSPAQQARVEQLRRRIAAGLLVVPAHPNAVGDWTPPDLP